MSKLVGLFDKFLCLPISDLKIQTLLDLCPDAIDCQEATYHQDPFREVHYK